MRLFVITLVALLSFVPKTQAQSFLQHLRQDAKGKGTVTVTQGKDIDELVDKANVSGQKPSSAQAATATGKPSATPQKPATGTTAQQHKTAKPSTTTPGKKENAPQKENNIQRHEAEKPHTTTRPTDSTADAAADETDIDMRKKMPKRSYKVNGYRVQVFAGGNSRDDKLKAQKAGNDVKRAFPEQPVYVHFYSPRWICRIGNFRTYEEANSVLRHVKGMGYKQACIVSGKITVAY